MTSEQLKELLEYCPFSGIFTWKRNRRRGLRGKTAGSLNPRGYIHIIINNKSYKAHRLAWLYVMGKWPSEIDHINGQKTDNRLENLREVSHVINGQNQKRPHITNKSGLLGVSWHNGRKKWQARITYDGKQMYLGIYDDPQEAHQVYLMAKRQYHQGCTL